jgi:site-specific DNA recombinase
MEWSTELDPRSNREEDDDTETTTFAAIYARTSSASQEFGYSLDEQVRHCWEHCQSEDWTVRYVFTDEAESGRDTERPEFQKMVKQAEARQIDVVVFWSLDRFCRSLADLVRTEEKLSTWDVRLHSVTEFIDTTTPVGRFNFRNLASAAELESDLTSLRSKMGLFGLAKDHKWPNDMPPIGYYLKENNRLGILVDEARLVYRIFESYLEELSMPEVAFKLNQAGHTTKDDNDWCRQSVQNVLSNELYIGHYEVAGFSETVDEYRILPDGLFDEVTEARYRFQHTKPAMDRSRKEAKANRILEKYKKARQEDT